ncbi:TfoX/Sxy family DNA transformation protein [uncultured Sphingomonas sp.]|uniref:TfoX/Sxy family DNA transformation protein n=1 Tax=uncultured Sphingomonas sp. TaxID=158754 RepID=UPI0025851E08|nr:TfoX/Sxy family DNA transformation protein [uncultured Sphingomonas sp.]
MTTSPCDDDRLTRLTALRNVAAKSAGWMIEVGVDTPERLAELGAVETYCRMKAAHPREVSLCAVWALQGAIDDVPTSRLSADTKQALKDAVAERRNGPRDA